MRINQKNKIGKYICINNMGVLVIKLYLVLAFVFKKMLFVWQHNKLQFFIFQNWNVTSFHLSIKPITHIF